MIITFNVLLEYARTSDKYDTTTKTFFRFLFIVFNKHIRILDS